MNFENFWKQISDKNKLTIDELRVRFPVQYAELRFRDNLVHCALGTNEEFALCVTPDDNLVSSELLLLYAKDIDVLWAWNENCNNWILYVAPT